MFKRILSLAIIFLLFFSSTQAIAKQPKKHSITKNNHSVKIVRDHYGVPHIYAKSTKDLYRTYGYVMAQDRLFQLVMFRRSNEGNVSSIFGEKYLDFDMRMRRDGYNDQQIKENISKMDPFSQKVMNYFAEGINKYVKEALKNPDHLLSKEFHDYHVTPEMWSDVDVLRLFMSSMTVFMDEEQELENARVLSKLKQQYGSEKAEKMFNDIYPVNDPTAPTSIMSGEAAVQTQQPKTEKQVSQAAIEAGSKISKQRKEFEAAAHELGIPLKVGSNAMVVGPKKSKSGNAMVFGGPQVGLSAPGFIYEVGLHAPGLDIEGSSFVGYPFIMFGATKQMGFTATAGYGNVVDLFSEKLNPQNPHQYFYKGKWTNMKKRVEAFDVRTDDGKTKTVEKVFYETVHGPVIDLDEKSHTAYSKAWAFRGTEGQSWSAYLESNYAHNLNDFAKTARKFTMSLNWHYADKQGNIAYFHVGKIPNRDKRIDQRLPTPGTGEYDWKGYLNPKNNPHVINPESGFVANWNNKPAPNWTNGELSYKWTADHRVQQYIDQAKAADHITLDKINDFNYHASLANLRTKWFKPYLLDALKKNIDKNPTYNQVYQYLQNWNNLNEDLDKDGYYDRQAITIFEAWWSDVVDNLFKENLGDSYGDLKDTIDQAYGCGLCLRVFQGKDSKSPVYYNWLNGENRDQLILTSLDQALNQLETKYNGNMDQWLTKVRTTTFGGSSFIGFPHGLGSDIPIPVMNRGSENHYVELTKKGPYGFNITPPGQVGFISKDGTVHQHYEDQVKMYEDWKFKPILFTKKEVKTQAESVDYLQF
ncbi:penicillin acylase family protein [Bacillus sp. UNC438CL73TsuS30]|uniref:penicillin acylase family protein n=1 Tax=Bacillus sp. UNC438CL73TsuS30 TaxID=1340434 RepID=UPI000478BA57|nr:penicillin acylase family protein [Bacillus sp. UNC438CL73TsuS30]QCL11090.1 penicillin G acylase [synthetic construct]